MKWVLLKGDNIICESDNIKDVINFSEQIQKSDDIVISWDCGSLITFF